MAEDETKTSKPPGTSICLRKRPIVTKAQKNIAKPPADASKITTSSQTAVGSCTKAKTSNKSTPAKRPVMTEVEIDTAKPPTDAVKITVSPQPAAPQADNLTFVEAFLTSDHSQVRPAPAPRGEPDFDSIWYNTVESVEYPYAERDDNRYFHFKSPWKKREVVMIHEKSLFEALQTPRWTIAPAPDRPRMLASFERRVTFALRFAKNLEGVWSPQFKENLEKQYGLEMVAISVHVNEEMAVDEIYQRILDFIDHSLMKKFLVVWIDHIFPNSTDQWPDSTITKSSRQKRPRLAWWPAERVRFTNPKNMNIEECRTLAIHLLRQAMTNKDFREKSSQEPIRLLAEYTFDEVFEKVHYPVNKTRKLVQYMLVQLFILAMTQQDFLDGTIGADFMVRVDIPESKRNEKPPNKKRRVARDASATVSVPPAIGGGAINTTATKTVATDPSCVSQKDPRNTTLEAPEGRRVVGHQTAPPIAIPSYTQPSPFVSAKTSQYSFATPTYSNPSGGMSPLISGYTPYSSFPPMVPQQAFWGTQEVQQPELYLSSQERSVVSKNETAQYSITGTIAFQQPLTPLEVPQPSEGRTSPSPLPITGGHPPLQSITSVYPPLPAIARYSPVQDGTSVSLPQQPYIVPSADPPQQPMVGDANLAVVDGGSGVGGPGSKLSTL